MLARKADHLYWMARYTERAENIARMLDVTYHMSLVPQATDDALRGWRAVVDGSGLAGSFDACHAETAADEVITFMAFDRDNPSSICRCIEAARENAHAVRGTLTTEMWETLNATWIDIRERSRQPLVGEAVAEFCEWVKMRSSLSRGTTLGTLLRDEAFQFIRLGTFIERADNTARLLDVKCHQIEADGGRGINDYYTWGALLRSVSAFEDYRRVYRDVMTPARVAELLVFNAGMPRSLHACLDGIDKVLGIVANAGSAETSRRAGMLHASLHYGRIEEVLEGGLHRYLTRFLGDVYDLGNRIGADFLVPHTMH